MKTTFNFSRISNFRWMDTSLWPHFCVSQHSVHIARSLSGNLSNIFDVFFFLLKCYLNLLSDRACESKTNKNHHQKILFLMDSIWLMKSYQLTSWTPPSYFSQEHWMFCYVMSSMCSQICLIPYPHLAFKARKKNRIQFIRNRADWVRIL